MTIKVGDTIYVRTRNVSGKINLAAGDFRYFTGYLVEGETPRSWLVKKAEWADPIKVSKSGLTSAGDRYNSGWTWYTREQAEAEDWKARNYGALSQAFTKANADQLKQIAAILGHDENESTK